MTAARWGTLTLTLLFSFVLLFCGIQLGMTITALPFNRMLEAIPALEPGEVAEASAHPLVERWSLRSSDRDVLWGRYLTCRAQHDKFMADGQREDAQRKRSACLKLLRRSVRSDPAAPRVWLEIAVLAAVHEGVSDSVISALRNSYLTGAEEAWVASVRVPFGLRIWQSLPPDLADAVANDLAIVAPVWRLNFPLLDAYLADPLLRKNVPVALEKTDPDVGSTFLRMLHRRMQDEG